MRWNKRVIISVILIMIAVGFSIIKLQDTAYIKNHYTTESIRFSKDGVTEKDLKTAQKNEKTKGSTGILDITAWIQTDEEEICNYDLKRTVKVPVVMVAGNMDEVSPISLLYGNYVYQKDSYGCIVDEDTAYSLYGTDNVVGNTLSYKNLNYYVRGVVKTTNQLLMIPGNNTTKYTNLELKFKNKELGESLAEQFLLQNGYMQNYVIIDGYFYGRILYSILNLPIWLFFILICILILKYLWIRLSEMKRPTFALYYGISGLSMIGFGSILYQFTGNVLYYPLKIIPSKLSDFNYWNEEFHIILEQVRKMQFLSPNYKDIYLENELLKLSLNITVMTLLYLLFLIQFGIYKKERRGII